MFTITKSQTVELYGKSAAEVYEFEFHDTGELNSVSLKIYEENDLGNVFRTTDNLVVEREDIPLDSVPPHIKQHFRETLQRAEEDF